MAKSKIGRNDALKIAHKIGAEIQKDGKHQKAILRHNGLLILTFGIRHGSKAGHGHLIGENGPLKLNATKISDLARCALTCEEYFGILVEKGVIPNDGTVER